MRESLEDYLSARRELVETFLEGVVGRSIEWPDHLHRAIAYSLYPGGKRIRPMLALAAYEAVAVVPDPTAVLPIAAGIELIHTYTLIHDDLPQMDDDDLRRGKPTNHRVHGEALAILAGDALQALAFQIISDRRLYPAGFDASVILEILHDVACAAGEEGVVGGQSMDLGYEGEVKAAEHLAFLYAKKTGGLIRSAVLGGARAAGADPYQLHCLTTFGDRLGLAFQLSDDLIDEKDEPSAAAGKARSVPSIVELIGARTTQEWVDRAVREALNAIHSFDERADPLRVLAQWLAQRKV